MRVRRVVTAARSSPRTRARSGALIASAALLHCGGATPLLHPAQVLAPGDVRGEAGIAARAVVGDLGSSLNEATSAAAVARAQNTTPSIDTTYAQGALVAAAMAPDLSPVAGARVGVGGQFEGGIMYTGRGARIDLRRAFGQGTWALSVGLGLDTAFSGRQTDALAGVDNANLLGVGGDVPVVAGYRSTSGLYYAWIGARVGYEHDTIQPRGEQTIPPPSQPAPTLAGDRVFVGGLLGVAMGFRHVHVALELEGDYATVWGSFGGVSASVAGLSLTPASAVWWDF
jgi:hypothetical protein